MTSGHACPFTVGRTLIAQFNHRVYVGPSMLLMEGLPVWSSSAPGRVYYYMHGLSGHYQAALSLCGALIHLLQLGLAA